MIETPPLGHLSAGNKICTDLNQPPVNINKEVNVFGIGMPELTIILIVVLFVFGASKLPDIGAGLGKGIRNFKRSISATDEEMPIRGSKSTE